MSPFQAHFNDVAIKKALADGLRQIYRDSFEKSLLCWVTERNCPYEAELRSFVNPNASHVSTTEDAALQLRDNRFTSRVSRLDVAFSRLRGRNLSRSEDLAATKALQKAVMAFASQWSHTSHNRYWRNKEGLSEIGTCQPPSVDWLPATNPTEATDFERRIKQILWHEAWTAIQAAAEIDSFKVILAYMIFALTQRPVEVGNKLDEEAHTLHRENTLDSHRGSNNAFPYEQHIRGTDATMENLVNEEWDPFHANGPEELASPPIYLEAAVRNLFSWRRKIESHRRLHSKKSRGKRQSSVGPFAIQDHQAFNLLFWLGVMCDTTSSAISKRPLVISDEDCAMIQEIEDEVDGGLSSELERYPPINEEGQNDNGNLWGDYLLSFTGAQSIKTQHRWPCSFEEAASVLQQAIPVKVLMFRKVAALQTLVYRGTPTHQLEKCINDALRVYQHWNSIYLPFMNDCANQYDNLPPNVKSWYVLLDGHWHYGCLLLADTILQVDKEGRTTKKQKSLRDTHDLIRNLRHDNALAIAKIAKVSLLEHTPSVPNNPEVHFACNGSAILTEPWTDVLVRAMSSACKVFINGLSALDDATDPNHEWFRATNDYDNLYSQADACIQGMTLLGRKSDAANRVAEVCWTKLIRVCSSRRSSTETIDGVRL